MADLTESEKKMIRERAIKHGCSLGGLTSESLYPDPSALAALSELLLAMKERAASLCSIDSVAQAVHDGDMSAFDLAEAIRNSDFGDLFKEKV